MIDYKVGQVVYLLSPKTLKIMPALIVEEITRKTVNDVSTQFVLKMPDKAGTTVTLNEVSARVFNDISLLRNFMLDNTRNSVEQLINNAITMKDQIFGDSYVDISSEARADEVMDLFVEKKKTINKIKDKARVLSKSSDSKKINENDNHVQKDIKSVIINGANKSNNAEEVINEKESTVS
tara:strand:+ start:746 stop:1285 length:540 start_codon:yes stop_codon:yes gene_type:complete